MKKLAFLLLFLGVTAVTVSNAQSGSRLSGKEFTVMVNKSVDPDPSTQIIDVLNFTGTDFTSQTASRAGASGARFTETLVGNKTNFSVTLTKSNGETWVYNGMMEDNHMGGTIVITRSGQAPETLEFRGMTTQIWNATFNTPQQQQAPKQ